MALATSLAGIVAAATAFHAPATPTIVSQYQPDPTYVYAVRGLAYDGMPEPAPHIELATPHIELATVAAAPRPTVAAAEAIDIPALICSYGWDCATALRIATCESGLQSIQNASGGPFYGIFQLWIGHFRPGEDWRDPATNIAVAWRVYQSAGWAPWQCR